MANSKKRNEPFGCKNLQKFSLHDERKMRDLYMDTKQSKNGVWLADFSGLFDLVPGTGGRSQIQDEFSNATAVDWNVPLPLWRDEFDGQLAEGWDWENENSARWSLDENPGFLRIYLSPEAAGGENLLLRPVAPGDLTNVDAKLGSLQNNGGPTLTQALLSTSPAIDAGNPDGCRDHQGNLLNTDQRGVARIRRCDIGAYEYDSDYVIHNISLPILMRYHCPDFFDDFSNPASGWFVGEDDLELAGYMDGEYRVVAKSDAYIFMYRAPTCGHDNYTAEMDARWAGSTGASYGLVFEIKGDFTNYYLFEVNSD